MKKNYCILIPVLIFFLFLNLFHDLKAKNGNHSIQKKYQKLIQNLEKEKIVLLDESIDFTGEQVLNFEFLRKFEKPILRVHYEQLVVDRNMIQQFLEKHGYILVQQSKFIDTYKLQEIYYASGILHIGANTGQEMNFYNSLNVSKVFWIEAIPETFEQLRINLENLNSTKVKHISIKALVTDQDDQVYPFHLFSNGYASSSIFAGNNEIFWDWVHEVGVTNLVSKKLSTVLKENKILKTDFDYVLIDTQGSELLVLKGFEEYLDNVKWIEVEVSQRPFYHGGVLFPELNSYLNEKGFIVGPYQEIPDHGNIVYVRK